MKAEKYEMEAANDILREKNQPISTYTYAVVKTDSVLARS